MDEFRAYPENVRALGNVMSIPAKEEFTLNHSKIEDIEVIEQDNIEFQMFRITLQGIQVMLEVSDVFSTNAGEDLSILVKLTRLDTSEPTSFVDIYFFENDELIDSIETDINGEVSFVFNSQIKGTHLIKIVTYNQLEFDGTDKTISVHVYYDTYTSLTATPETPDLLEDIVLSAKLDTEDGKILSGEIIEFYNNEELIGTATTDEDGVAKLVYEGDNDGGL